MALFEIIDLTFSYPDERVEALSHFSLSIEEGEFIVLCGPSGCGKTTLLRYLNREIQPVGKRSGVILYHGRELEEWSTAKTSKEIGMVFQDPEAQIVATTVWHELAFSMENFGYPPEVIRKRVAEMASYFGMEDLMHRSIHELSGGQKQLLNLASVLTLHPRVLLLDEPTSQLDPIAAREFLLLLKRINEEFSITIVLSEHRLDTAFPLADKVVVLEAGSKQKAGSPQDIVEWVKRNECEGIFPYLPSIAQLYLSIEKEDAQVEATGFNEEPELGQGKEYKQELLVPLTVKEGRRWISRLIEKTEDTEAYSPKRRIQKEQVLIDCSHLSFQYEKHLPPIINKLSLQVHQGEFLAIVGGNGAGKSTLLKIMVGLLEAQRGRLLVHNKKVKKMTDLERCKTIGYLAQNPLTLFLHDSVEEELNQAIRLLHVDDPEKKRRDIISFFQLQSVLHKHPYDCSGGERQKLGLALTILANPSILLLDEPTKGLDPVAKAEIGRLLQELQEQGTTIVMVTHDIEFIASHASRCAMLFNGVITSEGEPHHFSVIIIFTQQR
ncbi:ABC transporter ATP-binding protein [Caldalkalibacillus mannanilyticus]|uniref:ABC transporter ATP-binding protein n=1 Tax=Caldalkalibacillus mannanilyticus TaxID=1418 RepID=UPI000B1C65C2|nr:ABC transporter ATP-binding protein [Caldalkalibacillus mannanilyticus]